MTKKVFLDCGTNLGQGLLQFVSKGIVDDTIDLIDEIYIEWHNHLLKSNYNTQMFIDEIRSRNIKVESWI